MSDGSITSPGKTHKSQELTAQTSLGNRFLALPWLLICLIGTLSFPLIGLATLTGAVPVPPQTPAAWLGMGVGWALITVGTLLFWWGASPQRLRLDFGHGTYTLRQGLWPWMPIRSGKFTDVESLHLRVVERGRGRVSCRVMLRWRKHFWGFTLRNMDEAPQEAEAWARETAERLGVPFQGVFHLMGYAGAQRKD